MHSTKYPKISGKSPHIIAPTFRLLYLRLNLHCALYSRARSWWISSYGLRRLYSRCYAHGYMCTFRLLRDETSSRACNLLPTDLRSVYSRKLSSAHVSIQKSAIWILFWTHIFLHRVCCMVGYPWILFSCVCVRSR